MTMRGGESVKKSVVVNNRQQFLRVDPVRRSEHLAFGLCNFNFFRNSERGNVLFFGSPRVLAPLVVLPYVLALEIVMFRKKRFFVRLEKYVVGMFVVREKSEALYVSSLAVAPEARKCGVATYILTYCERLARILGKDRLELLVLKTNTPAQRLYRKFRFSQKEERKWGFVLSKKVEN